MENMKNFIIFIIIIICLCFLNSNDSKYVQRIKDKKIIKYDNNNAINITLIIIICILIAYYFRAL